MSKEKSSLGITMLKVSPILVSTNIYVTINKRSVKVYVLNPTRVPFSTSNRRTLGSSSVSRLRQVDIEVPNNPGNKDSWGLLACYP